MPITKEQLLAEAEDLLRDVPTRLDIIANKADALSWLGRFSAVIHAWDYTRSAELRLTHQMLVTLTRSQSDAAYGQILALLHEARHARKLNMFSASFYRPLSSLRLKLV